MSLDSAFVYSNWDLRKVRRMRRADKNEKSIYIYIYARQHHMQRRSVETSDIRPPHPTLQDAALIRHSVQPAAGRGGKLSVSTSRDPQSRFQHHDGHFSQDNQLSRIPDDLKKACILLAAPLRRGIGSGGRECTPVEQYDRVTDEVTLRNQRTVLLP